MILKQDGSVWSTAITLDGLGAPKDGSKYFIQVIPHGAVAVAAGISYSMVLKENGKVWASRQNSRAQMHAGTKTIIKEDMFYFVQTIPGATAIAAGGRHRLVMAQKGRVWAAGWNKYVSLVMDLHRTKPSSPQLSLVGWRLRPQVTSIV